MSAQNVSVVVDSGKVRLGGLGPIFKPAADAGKVRLGGLSPLFR